MRIRKLKKEFGRGFEVSRDRRAKVAVVAAGGLSYSVQEAAFRSEAELAQHIKSKVPVATLRPPH